MSVRKKICMSILLISSLVACTQQSNTVKISSSSVLDSYTADGLLDAKQPGWHAKSPPVYPQILTFAFPATQRISQIGLLPQDGQISRGPKTIVIEVSDDEAIWKEVSRIDNACNNPGDNWRDHALSQPLSTKYIRLTILSNCGDPAFLTLRGVRFK